VASHCLLLVVPVEIRLVLGLRYGASEGTDQRYNKNISVLRAVTVKTGAAIIDAD
jgi:hypothetical protein